MNGMQTSMPEEVDFILSFWMSFKFHKKLLLMTLLILITFYCHQTMSKGLKNPCQMEFVTRKFFLRSFVHLRMEYNNKFSSHEFGQTDANTRER